MLLSGLFRDSKQVLNLLRLVQVDKIMFRKNKSNYLKAELEDFLRNVVLFFLRNYIFKIF